MSYTIEVAFRQVKWILFFLKLTSTKPLSLSLSSDADLCA